MRISRAAFAAILLTAIALPLAAQVNDTYVIPAAANAPGGYGTQWLTQLSIFNPQIDYPLKVSVTLLPSGGGKALEALITIPANSVQLVDNALGEIFGVSGSGALIIATFPEDNPGVPNDMVSRSFLVTSNTYTKTFDGGTYGQTVPGVWAGLQDYRTDPLGGVSAIAHGVRNISRYGWRTNYGAVNLGNTAVTLRISVYDKFGATVVKNFSRQIPAQSHMQWQLPVEVDGGSIEFFLDDATGQGVAFPYASTLDRYTGDPTYQSPTLLASAKSLYSKGALAPVTLGKRIDINTARAIRATSMKIGEVQLKQSQE